MCDKDSSNASQVYQRLRATKKDVITIKNLMVAKLQIHLKPECTYLPHVSKRISTWLKIFQNRSESINSNKYPLPHNYSKNIIVWHMFWVLANYQFIIILFLYIIVHLKIKHTFNRLLFLKRTE